MNKYREMYENHELEWADEVDFIQCELLGFCTCGCPEENVDLVGRVLHHINRLKTHLWAEEITYDQWKEEGAQIGNDTWLYFMYYYLDDKGFTDHGGAVPGWLTEDGEALLEYIIDIFKEEGSDE